MSKPWMVALALALFGAAAVQAGEPLRVPLKIEDLKLGDIELIFGDDQADVLFQRGEFWLGVAVAPPSAELRKKLELPADEGLVVQEVVPGSPAAKAGIKVHDVLLRAADKPLKGPVALVRIVNMTKDQKLAIVLLRDGKKQTVTLVPAKRRAEPPRKVEVPLPGKPFPGGPMMDRLIQVLEGPVALPDDVTVVITKKGKEPAKVVVERGTERWEATEKDLSKLPDKLRPQIERMLGRGGMTMRLVPPPGGAREKLELREFLPGERPVIGDVERRLKDMNRQIEELRKAVDQLRGERKTPLHQDKKSDDRPKKNAQGSPDDV
jgi:hypothetical protein